MRVEYDLFGNITEKEFANNRIDRYADFDTRGNPGTVTLAAESAEKKVVTYTWHPHMNQPLTRTEQSVIGTGLKITTWDYDDDGNSTANENPTMLVHRLIISGYTLDSAGVETPVESITKFTYNAKGQLLSVDGPLAGTADTTSYTYDATTGDILSMVRPESGATTFSNHDGAGRPGRKTDPNLNSLDYTYDGRGLPTTITRVWDSAVTSYTYNNAGKPTSVTLANGTSYAYAYDSATGLLETISDALGNTIEHDYDSQGNIIDTSYHLPAGTPTFWQRFDYQYPNRPGYLWKQINPDNTYFEYAYDDMGNRNQVTDPAGKITTFDHDDLNRQTSITQPGTVTTDYVYDGQGNMVLVTDPESNDTDLTVDDLGRTVEIISPDSGTTNYTFDLAGNLVSKTDANNITSTFSYDDEYRLTGISYPDTTQNVTYTYDLGTDGAGRLTGMTDPSGSYVYTWDEAGNLESEQKTINSVVYTTDYTYDEIGLITSITYPDGLVVTWQRDNAGNVTAVTATRNSVTQTLANNIVHLPFGPIDDMTLGNSSSVDRSFDQQYLMTDILTTGIQDLDYAYDLLGNVTGIDNNLDATRDLTFVYDDLYRITSATGVYGSIGFSFDDVGNWQSRTEGGATETYTYTVDTNRLDLITNAGTVDIVTDAAGNTTGYGSKTFIYNQSNRLVEIEDNSVTLAEYVYSADGRRMKKAVSGQITIYHYDIAGRLIAESDGLGNFNRLYVYVDSEPLAQITLNGASENTYYYHNDHLGTPQKMTDSSGIVVWAIDYKPFGAVNITVNTVQNNLRFAGQYFDAESGLHYNYYRYYDPAIGRYLTPDPIGLSGGLNLYVYAYSNPINFTDPYGLEPPQNIPSGVNMEQNVKEAEKMSSIEFYNAVKSEGKWDYKTQGKQYEEFGNYNFGMAGRAAGYSENILKRGAGVYQIYSGTSSQQWGWPWGSAPYGDDPMDQYWIDEGVKDFEEWRDSSCP